MRQGTYLAGRFFLLGASCLLFLRAPTAAAASSKTFTGSSGMDWLNDANWMPAGTPAAGDDVTIPTGKTADLSADRSINSLTLAGTLAGSGNLSVSGLLTWTAGTMSGAGVTNANGGLALSGAGSKSLQRTLNNAAAATWSDNGNLIIGANAAFNNLVGASFTAQNDRTLSGGSTSHFENAGTFIKTSAATTNSTAVFDNSGTVDVQAGTLQLTGGGTHTGAFAANGATLEFNGGNHSFNGSTSINVSTVLLSGGTTNIAGSFSAGVRTQVSNGTHNLTGGVLSLGDLAISGGTFNLSNSEGNAATPTLTMTNGTLSGSSNLSVTGPTTWLAGTMSGVGTTNANGPATLSGAATKTLNRTLNSAMSAVWSGTGPMSIGATGTFNNLAEATFRIENDATLNGATGSRFNNAGTFTKSAGSLTRVVAAFNNSGAVVVESGTLQLAGGGSDSGSFNFPAAALEFAAGVHNLEAAAQVNGMAAQFTSGTVNMAGHWLATMTTKFAGGMVTFSGSVGSLGAVDVGGATINLSTQDGPVAMTTLALSSGSLVGASNVNVQGPLTWSGGSLGGVGATNANGGLTISGSATKTLSRTLNNAGAALWSDSGALTISATGTLNNLSGASFTVQNDAPMTSGGPAAQFNNAGRFIKALGTLTRVAPAFHNSGSVEVMTGTLKLDGGGSHSGTFSAPTATIEFGGAASTSILSPSSSIAAANATFSGGATTILGDYNVTTQTTLTNGQVTFGGTSLIPGSLSITTGTAVFNNSSGSVPVVNLTLVSGTLDGSSTVNVAGMLNWQGGTMTGSGVTNANGSLLLSTIAARTLMRTFNNNGGGRWIDGGSLAVGVPGVFHNAALASFDLQSDGSVSGGAMHGRLDNDGTLRKSLGALTTIAVSVNNRGLVEAQSGTLSCSLYTQTAGSTRLIGGALQSPGGVNIAGGVLEGSGSVTGTLTNNGVVSPGLSPGIISPVGSFVQTASGSLKVELGGTSVEQFDQLWVNGPATLNGTLNVSLTNGYQPRAGDSFPIVTFTSVSGDFATTHGLVTGVGRGFSKVTAGNSVRLVYGEENCGDGIDNDHDGVADCADPKCVDFAVCGFSPTPTATRSATPTPTKTSTGPPANTATATATPIPGSVCVGDCGHDGEVTVDELLTMVNIALGSFSVSACGAGDKNNDGEVTIDEILVAVNNALNGCMLVATPTPAAGDATDIGTSIALGAGVITNVTGLIPNVITALVTGGNLGAGAAAVEAVPRSIDAACPLGGSAVRTGSFPVIFITLNACKVPTGDGSVVFTGTISLQVTTFNVSVGMEFKDNLDRSTQTANATLQGTVSPSLGGSCFLSAATLQVTVGSLTLTLTGGPTVGMSFTNTTIAVTNISFSPTCGPTVYRLTLTGPAALQSGVTVVPVTFSPLSIDVDDRPLGNTFLSPNGTMSSPCFGGSASLSNNPPLSVLRNAICPNDGKIRITAGGGIIDVNFKAAGNVEIDVDGDGSVEASAPNCLDPRLLMCLA